MSEYPDSPLITPSMREDFRMWFRRAKTQEEREELKRWIVAMTEELERQEGEP